MTNDELTKLADRIYDIAMNKAIAVTPPRIASATDREIWQTTYIDNLLNKAITSGREFKTGFARRIQQIVPANITDNERKELMGIMYDWNHEHELEEQPVYILNPDHEI